MTFRSQLIRFLTSPRLFMYMGFFVLAAFLMAGISLADMGVILALIEQSQLDQLGFDLIMASLGLMIAVRMSFVLLRRQGYGSVPICTGALLIYVLLLSFLNSYLLPILFIFKYAFFTLLISSLWGVAKRFGNLSLRDLLFKIIVAGELFGFLIAGVLIGFLPDVQLILWSSFPFLALFLLSLKRAVVLHPVPSESFVKKTPRVAENEHQKLMIRLCYVSFFCWMGKSLMDYTLIEQLSLFPLMNAVFILGLLTLSFGIIGLVLLLCFSKISFLSTLYWGMKALPFLLLGSAFAVYYQMPSLFFCSYLFWGVLLFFYFVRFSKIVPQILAYTQKTSVTQTRLFWIEPVGFLAGAIGVSLFENKTEQSLFLLISAAGFGFFLWAVFRSYHVLLGQLVDLKIWRDTYFILTPSWVKKIRLKLKKTDSSSLIFAVNFFKQAMHPLWETYLKEGLKSSDPATVLFCLEQLELHPSRFSFFKDLLKLFEKTSFLEVKNKALSLIIEQKSHDSCAESLTAYMPFLEDKNLLEGALTGFLRVGGNYTLLATQKLQQLMDSRKKEKKLQVLRIIQKVPYPAFYKWVEQSLKQNQVELVKEALRAAGSLKTPKLLPLVFNSLDDVALQEEALAALKSFGKRAFPPLEKMLTNPKVPLLRRKQLILFLGFLPSGEGKQILIRSLDDCPAHLKLLIIQTLLDSGIFWVNRKRKGLLKKQIQHDLEHLSFLKKQQQHFVLAPVSAAQEAFDFIRQALEEEIEQLRRLILYQLMLIYRHPFFAKSVRLLLQEDSEQHQLAWAVIQDFMPSRFFKKLKTAFTTQEILHQTVASSNESVDCLTKLICACDFDLSPWLRACLLYALRRLNLPEGKEAVCHALTDSNPLVFEAAIWALARLEKDKKQLYQLLLSSPTSVLAGPALESILNDI